ncbi:MAG: phosphatidate cytidylyltransferase [Candidatus Helarchaeota archaeon]
MVVFNSIDDIILGIPIIILLFAYGLMFIGYTIKTSHDKEKTLEMKLNEATAGMLYFPAAIIITLVTPLILIIDLALIATFGAILILILYEKKQYNRFKKENNTEELEKRNLESFIEKLPTEYTLERDISRKVLHTISPTVILMCFLLGKFINPLAGFGLDNNQFTIFLVVFFGGIFLILFASAELIRLMKFELLPPSLADMFAKAMKKHEFKSITATTTIILGLVPFLFLPIVILVAIGITSVVADAAASIVGKKYGKHKFPKGGKKSIEGYISGTLTAFLIIFIICWLNSLFFLSPALFPPSEPWNLFQIVILGLVGAIVFLIIDIANPPIDDNIINPLFIGLALTGTLILLGI